MTHFPIFSLFSQTSTGTVTLNGFPIDHLNYSVNRIDILSQTEYYYLVNDTLYHSISSVHETVADKVACMSYDFINSKMWWIPLLTDSICSHEGCNPAGREARDCAEMEVTDNVFLILSHSGQIAVDGIIYEGQFDSIPFVLTRGRCLVNSSSRLYLLTFTLVLALVALLLCEPNGKRDSRRLPRDVSPATGDTLPWTLRTLHARIEPEASDARNDGTHG